ncbi:MAG: 2-amino-4-oxopentanoate thiolase subunit OrtA [Candidatus Muiribacteriota bacterium]
MWVKIQKVILKSEQRTSKIPEDTLECDYIMHVNGYLEKEADLGEEVEIETAVGRKVKGKLIQINPAFKHDFGQPVEELMHIGKLCKKELKGGE